jgi:Flp pilus assembly protein TadD
LSLVVAAHERMRAWHRSTLAHLRAGRHAEALHAARSRYALSPDAEAARLLGVCLLLLGRFAAALEVYDAWR